MSDVVNGLLADAPDLHPDDYVVLGLATCFLKEEGEVQELELIEPIPSAALETIVQGIPTSYRTAIALPIATVLSQAEAAQLPELFPATAHWCVDWQQRAIAATRTYKSRPTAQQHVPLGGQRQDFNYSTERKRVLNANSVVRPEDNVKQHAYTHQVL
ncbi:MAG: hypothetical protein EA001_04395 [Oscillatoriales cyanobacterium]|nr:MAG: hypothetical protein EA001_04395 [Oscillatoriales cyanobacterium]